MLGWAAPLALVLAAGVCAAAERTYVGADACAQCHSDQAEWLARSAHAEAALKVEEGKSVAGCEVCHGPGSAHIEDLTPATIRTFRNEPASERSGACLACHGLRNAVQNFRRGDHDRRLVACDQCHAAAGSEAFHRMRAVGDAMRGAQPEVCFECHAAVRASFAMPYHHPVAERHMECTTCHQPHGAFTLRQLRTRNNEPVCGRCHEDHEGPFVFEHPAGRASGCVTCHQPHGSSNPKMLSRFQAQFLCLECHPNTPRSHDLTQERYRHCTVCHSRIHGSNLDPLFLK